jgi:hypothetical protein
MREDFLNAEHREKRMAAMRANGKRRDADEVRRKRHRAQMKARGKRVHRSIVRKVFASYHRRQWAQLRKDFEDIQRQHLKVA